MSPLHATQAEKSPELIALEAEIKENVLRGIEFLKEKYGEDYVEHIDMDKFDIRSGDACVLGQVHPAYYSVNFMEGDGYHAATAMFLGGRYGNEYGFSVNDDYFLGRDSWEVLQETWEEVLPTEKKTYERKKAAGLLAEKS